MNETQTLHEKLEMESAIYRTGELLKGFGSLLENASEIGKVTSISAIIHQMQLSEEDIHRLLLVDDLTEKVGKMIPVHDYTLDVVSAVNILLLQVGCDCGRRL